MFKKPKKNFRSRRANNDSDEENNEDDDVMIIEPEPPKPPPQKKAKKKKKEKISENSEKGQLPKSASTLSFDDCLEEGEDVFQIKKSSHSRRIAKMLKREHKREKEAEETKPQADNANSASGMYSAENLRKMRYEQENGHSPSVDMELGSDVEQAPDPRPHFNDNQDGEEKDKEKDALGGTHFKEMIARGQIPDASLIHLARKKRQAARERGDDYIPLEEEKKSSKPGSRLIREEDHDKSDDEDEAIEFNADHREKELRQMHSTILEAEQGSHSEGSDQETEWEKQQIRKGVQAGSTTADIDDVSKHYQQFYFGSSMPPMPNTMPVKNHAPIIATKVTPPEKLSPVTVDVIKQRLTDRLESLVSVHRAHIHERDDITSRMENISIGDESGGSRGLEERYKFFQEMRGYVGDLIECLSEKTTSINYLDRCMMNQWQQRADKIISRRQQDIKDQSQQFMTKKGVTEEVDEKKVEATQRRAAEREARRSRRRRARENRGVLDHYDGLSTDDEENKSETVKLNMERDHIRTQVRTMFDDVVDDFQNLNLIKSHFEMWKYDYGDTYDEAYIGLCLPKLFTPYIKLSLIIWNPFEENCSNYEEMAWYEALMFYGYREGKDLLEEDVDIKLMPSIVEKILLPKITALVESVWDPMSSQQTRRLVKLIRSFIEDYPTITFDSKHTQVLIQAVGERLKKSLDDDVFMPFYTPDILENRSSGASVFFHRQFWSCVKLLGNIFEWQGIMSDATLQKLGLVCLLNRYIVMALRMSPINSESLHRCQVVISMIPKSWFICLDGLSTLPLLETLCKHLIDAATTLEKATPNDRDCRAIAKENLKQIRKMLISLHAMDHAANLADKMS